MVERTLTRPEAEARRLLEQAQAAFAECDEPWPGYEVDIGLLASLVFGLGVQAVPDLTVGNREYAAFLKADSKLIVVEGNHHEHRRRFSIAHEIGHYVLHYLYTLGRQENFHCSPDDMEVGPMRSTQVAAAHLRREWEANLFAGELLMPERAVLAMFRVTGGNVLQLARHFHVSSKAMDIRLKSLPVPFAPVHR